MDRRGLLQTGAAALAALVPGCGLGPGGGTATPPDAESTPEATATADRTPSATRTAGPTPTPTQAPTATASGTPTPREAAQVVTVADGETSFDPKTFEVSVGDRVVWVWRSSGHNVRATARPRGSTFTGTAGGQEKTFDAGHTFSHTFEVAGEYEYHCYPYRMRGMTGSFTVTE